MTLAPRIMLVAGLISSSLSASQTLNPELEPAVHVMDDEAALDVQRVGHAAPCLGDFDGDGVQDLLVGQFEEGWLRIYRNQGTDAHPRFRGYEWFRAGADLGRVPTG